MMGWLGVALTSLFGALYMIQLVRGLIGRKVRSAEAEQMETLRRRDIDNLEAILKSLGQVRAWCTEHDKDTTSSTSQEQEHQFIQSIGHEIRGAEHSIEGLLGSLQREINPTA